MSDMLYDGFAWLNDQLKTHCSQTVTYRRGGDSVQIAATLAKAQINPLSLLSGVRSDRDITQRSPKHVDHRFSFAAADLILNGALAEPAEGDTIELTAGGKTKTFLLAVPLDGGPNWSYANGYEFANAATIIWNGRLKSVV